MDAGLPSETKIRELDCLEKSIGLATLGCFLQTLAPEKHKQAIEADLTRRLRQYNKLTDRQKYLSRNALGHTYRGLFGIADQDLREMDIPEGEWSLAAAVTVGMLEGTSYRTLLRSLQSLRGLPVQ